MSASIWNPGGTLTPQADPNSQIKSQLFTATEGQTLFVITNFTYVQNNGALQVFVNGVKQASSGVSEVSTTSFSIAACDVGDVIEVVGNTAIADATGAAAIAQDAAAAALVSETNAATSETLAQGYAASASSSASTAVAAANLAVEQVPLNWLVAGWATGVAYTKNDAFRKDGSSYVVVISHLSGVFATDLSDGKLDTIAEKGAAGAGTGDMLAANNLSDLADAATARANLGLGSAATTASTDYATAAQGGKADSAVQPAAIANMLETTDIGSTVQGYDADTAKTDVAQTFSAVQKTTVTTDNDLTIDLAALMDGVCTPTGAGTLSFSNIAAGVGFEVLFVNGSNYAIAKGANIKCTSMLFTTLSATGRYRLSGKCFDGTNVDLDISGAHV